MSNVIDPDATPPPSGISSSDVTLDEFDFITNRETEVPTPPSSQKNTDEVSEEETNSGSALIGPGVLEPMPTPENVPAPTYRPGSEATPSEIVPFPTAKPTYRPGSALTPSDMIISLDDDMIEIVPATAMPTPPPTPPLVAATALPVAEPTNPPTEAPVAAATVPPTPPPVPEATTLPTMSPTEIPTEWEVNPFRGDGLGTLPPTYGESMEESIEDTPLETVTETIDTGNNRGQTTAPDPVEVTDAPTPEDTPSGTMEPPLPVTSGAAGGGVVKRDRIPKRDKDFVGFQSSWGPTHAGAMVYDFTRNSLYVTGTTFAANRDAQTSSDFQRSSCFVGEIPLSDIRKFKTVDPPLPPGANQDFVVPDSLSNREVMGCHAIYFDEEATTENEELLYVGGVVELDATERSGSIQSFLNTYSRSRLHPDWGLEKLPVEVKNPTVITPTVDPAAPVRYPVAMSSGFTRSGESTLMLVTISSDDSLLTEKYVENGDANNAYNFKNSLLPPGLEGGDPDKYATPKRGSNYYLSFQFYEFDKNKKNIVFTEGRDIRTRYNGGSLYPTGVANIFPESTEYVCVGHIKGDPPPELHLDKPLDQDGNIRMDLDGFASHLYISPTRGDISIRFQSEETKPSLDDFVHDICLGPVDPDSKQIDYYFVVGSTYGTMPAGSQQRKITTNILSGTASSGNFITKLSAFVSKVDAIEHEVVWTTQLYATNDGYLEGGMTEAFGCNIVEQETSLMYVGGNVYDGGVMDTQQESNGSDDVWVAQLATKNGKLKWLKQIGSSGKDRISRTKGIQVDANGDCVLYGETTGELYRKRTGETINADDGSSTDVFISVLDRDDGMSESTVESDRVSGKKKGGFVGVGTALLVLSVVLGYFAFRKWGRPKRRGRSRPKEDVDSTEGLFSSNIMPTFHDEVTEGDVIIEDNVSQNYTDDVESADDSELTPPPPASPVEMNLPPQEAFKDDPDYRPGRNFV
eukprot:CAMPEP_0201174618 /NCGR_PEP_ID=MMETSP0851-20130426/99154_1 /ASSEMBLY_ACC=CAM_ASM_000631 /TAXON_ID=183588 /ORGANISM="Pseudo-nitzschia fraudulenta, Strain WWA7" /LENGTH=972 /DNA_ID=CAMNT_0047457603 /DNA_START=28 /DNA_END=2946 /DNA_ORIENTATION=+